MEQQALVIDALFVNFDCDQLSTVRARRLDSTIRMQGSTDANCAWDAFGICAALESDGQIESSCPDCGEPLAIDVRDERPDDTSLLFHCLVPAARWWDDIVFT